MKTRLLLVPAACLLAFGVPALADDWPQFRGPNRDDISRETGLLKTWPQKGPRLLWTCTDAGIGYSGPAVVGHRLYTMGARGDTEYVFALDLNNKGKELWSAKIGPMNIWKDNYWNAGPAATPTVDGDLVYALGGQGELVCVAADGEKVRWRKNLPKELGAEVNPIGGGQGSSKNEPKMGWGYNWSPLVDGKRLICVPGGPQGTLAALDKKTGAVIWRSKRFTDQATYSSPILAKVGGLRHYIQLTNEGITGIAAKDGALLWHYPKTYPDVLIPAPIFHDDQVYATGHLAGCDLVEVTATNKSVKAKKVYANRNMDNLEGGVLLVEGHVYGYSEGKGWVCQDFKTGKITASERRKLKRGSLAYADGHLYCYGEDDGTVVLVRAAPAQWTKTSWKEDGRFTIPRLSTLRKPRGKVWTHPVIADGKLFLRDQELLFCFDIKDHSAGNGSAAKGEDRGQ